MSSSGEVLYAARSHSLLAPISVTRDLDHPISIQQRPFFHGSHERVATAMRPAGALEPIFVGILHGFERILQVKKGFHTVRLP